MSFSDLEIGSKNSTTSEELQLAIANGLVAIAANVVSCGLIGRFFQLPFKDAAFAAGAVALIVTIVGVVVSEGPATLLDLFFSCSSLLRWDVL